MTDWWNIWRHAVLGCMLLGVVATFRTMSGTEGWTHTFGLLLTLVMLFAYAVMADMFERQRWAVYFVDKKQRREFVKKFINGGGMD